MGTHPIFESDFDCLTEWDLEMQDAFSGPQYDELNEFEKELKESKELWEQYPKIKFKARGMLMCWCLNFDIDPEEWRDDLAREVPVARKEGDINPWYQSGPFENEVREITDDRDKMYSRITNNVKKHYEESVGRSVTPVSQFQWKLLANRSATKERITSDAQNLSSRRRQPNP